MIAVLQVLRDRLLGNAVVVLEAIDTLYNLFNIDYHIVSLLHDSIMQVDLTMRFAQSEVKATSRIHCCILPD